MKLKQLLLSVCALLITLSAAAFELGKNNATIWHTKKSVDQAKVLQQYLGKVFGKKYTLKLYKNGAHLPGLFVGIQQPNANLKVDMERDFTVIHSGKDKVYIYGNDTKTLTGTAYAVISFLEKHAGVRFLWPGELGTVAEKRKPVTIKEGTDLYVPPFKLRMTSSFTYGMGLLSAKDAADLRTWLVRMKTGRSIFSHGSGFQHAFFHLMPREKYGKEHPEYYSLVTPARWIGEPKPTVPTRRNDESVGGPAQLCTSNKDVRRIIAEKIAAPKDGKIRSISPNDGFGFCECANCLAQDGKDAERLHNNHLSVTNRMYDFAEDIAHQVYKLNPKAKVGMFAYSFYNGVPDQKISFPPNMYLSYCYFIGFTKDKAAEDEINNKIIGLGKTGAQVVGREYWGTHYTMNYPLNHSRKIDRNIKALHKVNAAGIYGETGKCFAARATDLYILCKLSWDPTLNREALLKEFCDAAFGTKASPVMYEMFEKIEDRVEKCMPQFFTGEMAKFYPNSYAERNRLMSEVIFNDEFQKMCKPYIKKALKLADTADRKARIDFINRGIRMAAVTTESLRSIADLAAAGVDMPLTQPSTKIIRMEKKNLIKVATRAAKAEAARSNFLLANSGDNAITRMFFGSSSFSLRPWKGLSEIALIRLKNGTYNYLVNNSFEYYGYSWSVKSVKGEGKFQYTAATNRDADDNYMVPCHGGQGISLQLDMPVGCEMEITQQRKVSTDVPVKATFSAFVKSEGDPLDNVKFFLGGKELKGVWVDEKLDNVNNWHEIRFQSVELAPGDYELKVVASNPEKFFGTNKALTLNFDNFQLRLKDILSAKK